MSGAKLLTVFVVVCVEVICLCRSSSSTKMHYIHWNTSNPIFRIDNTDHIIDVNKGNLPFEYDQVNIICPVYNKDTTEDEAEKYIIYNVSKEEYDTCRITNPSPRVIAVCDKPYKLMYFTITFRSFTPQPGGLEFHPGQDYYFISTSSKEDLHRRIGGRCSTHHMKVVFKVCCDPAAQTPRDQANNHIPNNGPASTRGTSTTSSTTSTKPSTISTTPKTSSTTTSTSTTTTTTTHATTPHRTSTGHKNPDPHHNLKTTTKKTDTHQPDRSENEVVKNEELTLSSSPRASSSSILLALVLPLLLTLLTLQGLSSPYSRRSSTTITTPVTHS